MTDIVIIDAKRSPVGSFNGSLSSLTAHQIGSQVISGVLESSGLHKNEITETILGQVLKRKE